MRLESVNSDHFCVIAFPGKKTLLTTNSIVSLLGNILARPTNKQISNFHLIKKTLLVLKEFEITKKHFGI